MVPFVEMIDMIERGLNTQPEQTTNGGAAAAASTSTPSASSASENNTLGHSRRMKMGLGSTQKNQRKQLWEPNRRPDIGTSDDSDDERDRQSDSRKYSESCVPSDNNNNNNSSTMTDSGKCNREIHNSSQNVIKLRHVAKGETAQLFQAPGYAGRIGFITSMTNQFCGTCNRLRLTADGNLKVCLFGDDELSLRDLMRQGATDDDIKGAIQDALNGKHFAHGGKSSPEMIAETIGGRQMIKIGG